jgi:hypothetical protein
MGAQQHSIGFPGFFAQKELLPVHYFVAHFITSSPNGDFVINAGTHGPGAYNYRGSSSRTVALSVANPTFA